MALFHKIRDTYGHVAGSWRIYWDTYGGSKALLSSPYLHFALLFSLLCWPIWLRCHPDWAWFDICIEVIPNLLGFSLGGYAILLAFGSEKFRSVLAGPEDDGSPSPFLTVNATFVHFIVLQMCALLVALVGKGFDLRTGIAAWFGFTIFLYAVSVAVAAAFAILRLARWFDIFTGTGEKD